MTTYKWVGSATNSASDPTAWNPNGTPAAGDTVTMPSDTAADSIMNIGSAGLPGMLQIGPNGGTITSTINLTDPNTNIQLSVGAQENETLTVNAQQSGDTLALMTTEPGYVTTTINIAQGDTLNANGFQTGFSTLNVDGGPSYHAYQQWHY